MTAETTRRTGWGTPPPEPQHDAVEESILIAAARRGEEAAFEELMTRFERRIFRLAQNVVHNEEDAEEVVQETFINAFNHLDSFHGDARFSTWLTRIAINQALMKLRRRRAYLVPLDDPALTEDGSIPREIVDWGPNPEQLYSQSELRSILNAVIDELDLGQRLVFQLRDVEGLSTEEAAQMLGLTISAVKSRLLRARLELREKLNRYFRGNKGLATAHALRQHRN